MRLKLRHYGKVLNNTADTLGTYTRYIGEGKRGLVDEINEKENYSDRKVFAKHSIDKHVKVVH